MIKLLRNLRPYTFIVIVVIVVMFSQTMADLFLPNLMSDIVNKGMLTGDNTFILNAGWKMLLVTAFSGICAIIGSYYSSKAGIGLGRDLRRKVFSRVETYSLNEFDKLGTASLVTRTTNDITQVQNVVVLMLRMMITAPLMSVGGIIMAYSTNRKLTWVLWVSIPVLIISIILVAKAIIPLYSSMQKKIDKLNLVSREYLIGIRVIRAFNKTSFELSKFKDANVDLTNTAIKANKIMATLMPTMMLIMNLTSVGILWYGGKYIEAGNMMPGDMMAFLQYAMQIMFSFIMLSMMFVLIPRAQASAVRINEVLDLVPDIQDTETSVPTKEMRGYVEFQNVGFSYQGGEEMALKNINFSAKPGEVTAIIGGTGSGKSTLANLIPRFYDVTEGKILVDGIDVKDISQQDLRQKIGFVPQKAILFTGTIAENIRYGAENATDEEVEHAAEIAQATEFISMMKEGYDSPIAQGGSNVSGGQKQRLSIARALVRKPEIYIFDDSFSALDFKTDAKLRAALKGETVNATVIIVAQRISTVMDADRIIVLDEGEVVGIGKHKELLQSCDIYKEIVASQLSEEEYA